MGSDLEEQLVNLLLTIPFQKKNRKHLHGMDAKVQDPKTGSWIRRLYLKPKKLVWERGENSFIIWALGKIQLK